MSSVIEQIKLGKDCQDAETSHAQDGSVGFEAVGNTETELVGYCVTAHAGASLKDQDIFHEDGNIGMTVMEQDTNGALVMVLRNPQFSSLCNESDHPVVRPASVSKRQAECKVITDPRDVASQTDKTAALTSHEEILQDDVKSFMCAFCDLFFTDMSHLNNHTRQHSQERQYMDDTGLTLDMKVEGTLCKCRVYGVELTSDSLLKEHKKRHSRADCSKCCECGLGFMYCKCLKTRPGIHTGGTQDKFGNCDQRPTEDSVQDAQETQSSGDECYSCDFCGLLLMSLSNLKAHSRTHMSDACDLQDTGESQKIYSRTHTGNNFYKCDSCDMGFKYKSYLDLHKRVHSVEKPHKCDVCGVRFAYNGCLEKHKKTHTEENPNKCDICGVEFTLSSHLRVHKRMHTGDRPYACDVCGLKFTVSSSLVRHSRTHTGEKPYKCDICDKTFSTNFNLKKHIRVHTGERPYMCNVCAQEFTCSSHLKRHSVVHTGEKPYKCDICNVRFPFQSYLKVHKIIHTGEKPYKCDLCDMKFAYQSYLALHKRKHTEETS